MSKLSSKAALDIALKFNSIDVAEMMQRDLSEREKAGKISTEEYVSGCNRWNVRALGVAKELQSVYGIVPVGYARFLVNRNTVEEQS